MIPYLKYLLHRSGMFRLADACRYQLLRLRYSSTNRRFGKRYPDCIIPPDRFLYKTNQLSHRQFIADGRQTAVEIRDWVQPYLGSGINSVLDWGCGAGRVTRHLGELFPGAAITGTDPDAAIIAWNREHYPAISFLSTEIDPPIALPANGFDLIIALSVLTHIPVQKQVDWLNELYRLLSDNGILLLTTHGRYYLNKLTTGERRRFHSGHCAQAYAPPGSRAYAVYNEPDTFRSALTNCGFIVLSHADGLHQPELLGGQDRWIVRKTGNAGMEPVC